jgi:uncharacterized membrane protein
MTDTTDVPEDASASSGRASVWRHPLWIILLSGLLIRLYNIGEYSIWFDEASTILGTTYVDWDLAFLSSSESRSLPLFCVISLGWIGIGEGLLGFSLGSVESDIFLRILPTIFSVGLIGMTYVLAMHLFQNRRAALCAAWFLALSPFHVFYAQEFRPHSLYALLVAVCMYCSLRLLEDGDRKFWVGTIVSGVLAFYTYYFTALFFLSINVFALLSFSRYKHRIVSWTLCQLTTFVLIIPPLLMARRSWSSHAAAEEHWFPHPTIKTALITVKNLFAGFSANIPLYWTLFFMGSLILLVGVLASRKHLHPLKFILCMTAFPILFQIAFWTTQDLAFYTYRIQLAYTAPLYMLMGIGIVAIPLTYGRVAVAAIFSILTLSALFDVYHQNLHPVWSHVLGVRYKIDSRSAAHFVRDHWQDGDVIGHPSTITNVSFRFNYLPDIPQRNLSFTDEEYQMLLRTYKEEKVWNTVGFVPQRIEELIEGKKRIWFIQSDWLPFNQAPLIFEFRDWLDAHATRVERRQFDGIDVYLYDFDPEAVPDGLQYRRLENGRDHIDSAWSSSESGPGDADDLYLTGNRPLRFTFYPRESLEISNLTQDSVSLKGYQYPAAEILPAIALDREPDSNVWRPASTYYNQTAMQATLQGQESGRLEGEMGLLPGEYVAFVRVQSKAFVDSATLPAKLSVRISDTDSELIGAEIDLPEELGWHWVRIGSIQHSGTGIRMTLTASGNQEEEMSRIDVDRFAFVRPEQVAAFLLPAEFNLEIGPGDSVQAGETLSSMDAQNARRVTMEFQDDRGNGYTLFYEQ